MGTKLGRALGLALLLVTIPLSVSAPLTALADSPVLVVSGAVPNGSVTLTDEEIAKLPVHALTEQPTSFPEAMEFKGPLLADVLKLAGAAEGADISLSATDDYTISIAGAEIAKYSPILAREKNGVRMPPDDFGPFFVMWPFKEKPEIDNEAFQAKAIWQVVKIEVK